MKKWIPVGKNIIVYSVLILCVFLCPGRSSGADNQNQWVLKKDKAGIKIFLRDIPGSRMKEFRGIVYIKNTSLSTIIAIFDDTSSYTRWMYKCIKAEVLKKVNLYERYTYSVIDSPWPVWDRDMISHSIITQDEKDKAITVRLTGMSDYIPVKNKLVRVPRMRGAWTFKPSGPGTIMVIYQMHSEPGGSLPEGLANMAVVDIPFHTLEALREIVKEDAYKKACYPQIKEPVSR